MKMRLAIKYLLSALLLLGATSSFASIYYQSGTTFGTSYLSTGAEACTTSANCHHMCGTLTDYGTYAYVIYAPVTNTARCEQYPGNDGTSFIVHRKSGTCPLPLVDDGNGQCVEEAPYTCTADKVISVVVNRASNGSFPSEVCAEQSENTGDFCMYGGIGNPVITDGDTTTKLYRSASAEQVPASCGAQDAEVVEIIRLPFDPSSYTGELTANDTVFTSTSETYSPPNTVCVSNGNGTDTCVTVQTESVTTTANQGTTTTSDGSSFTQTVDAGTTITSSKTTSTTDDGQGTVHEQVDVTNTSHIGTKSTLVAGSYDFSIGSTPATESKTTTTTTTTTTNPDGTVTVEETTKTEEGAPEQPGDPDAIGNCGAPGQPACETDIAGSTDFDHDGVLANSGIIESIDSRTTDVLEIPEQDITFGSLNVTPLSMPNTVACNPLVYSQDYHTATFKPLEKFCQIYDDDIRPAFAWLLYGFTLFGLYSLFMRSIKSD